MATTTNYGWTTPNDTDLVKNGASAIRTTANAIDSSLFSITNGKNVGLVPIATTSFTAQTNIDILNCFSSTYDNYVIEIYIYNTGSSIDTSFSYQLLSGSTPATTNYADATFFINTSNASGSWTPGANRSAAFVTQFGTNGQISTAEMTLFQPNKATYTHAQLQTFAKYGTATAAAVFGSTGHFTATAYDGIRFSSATANAATGIIRVYGLRNS